jgi:hypothetical protein
MHHSNRNSGLSLERLGKPVRLSRVCELSHLWLQHNCVRSVAHLCPQPKRSDLALKRELEGRIRLLVNRDFHGLPCGVLPS